MHAVNKKAGDVLIIGHGMLCTHALFPSRLHCRISYRSQVTARKDLSFVAWQAVGSMLIREFRVADSGRVVYCGSERSGDREEGGKGSEYENGDRLQLEKKSCIRPVCGERWY